MNGEKKANVVGAIGTERMEVVRRSCSRENMRLWMILREALKGKDEIWS